MRFINVYLIGYFILVLGALAALWYGGALRHIAADVDRHRARHRRRARHHAVGVGRQAGDHSRIT